MNMTITSSQFLLFSILFTWSWFAFGATTLQPNEVQLLKDIAKTLGKKDWDFSIDPCSWNSTWKSVYLYGVMNNRLECNCSMPNDTFCHVSVIALKFQSLQGSLPPQLVRLRYLQEIDLSQNYLSGSIPREWCISNLREISLRGNRLTGPIPSELANLTNLKLLILEFNQFSGNLPPELGNLPHIEQLHLSSNNFTGELPATFGRLTTMSEFRINDNQFSGNIPNFIQNWKNLKQLFIQGSGLSAEIIRYQLSSAE